MSAQDTQAMKHLDAYEGHQSEQVEAPAGVKAVSQGEDGGRREGEKRGEAKEGGVTADVEASAGKASERPSTLKTSRKLRNPKDSKRRVKFSRKVVNQLVEMVEGPGTRNRRRIATGQAMGWTVEALAKPNMDKEREPEELNQDRIRAILGSFRGAPPVDAPKPNHCRKTCGRGPCVPETCACALGEVKCSLDARCQCRPTNCGNYNVVNPVRDVVKANAVWREVHMPVENDTIQSIDPSIVEEEEIIEEVRDGGADEEMDEEEKKDEGRGEESGDGSNGGEEGAEVQAEFDRFVTKRSRSRRNAGRCEEERREEAPRAPNNTQEQPTNVQHFLCYTCGAFFVEQREYQRHALFHELMKVAHHIWKLEPSFHLDVTTSFSQAALLLHAPYINVGRRKRCAMDGRTWDEPEVKRREMEDGSRGSPDDEEDVIVSIDDETLVEIEEEQSELRQVMIDQQFEHPDDRFVTRRRKEKVEEEGEESDQDDEEQDMGLDESMADAVIDEEDDEDDGESMKSEDLEPELIEEMNTIRKTLLDAGIHDIPIEEARDLVRAINMSRDGDGWIVLDEREEVGDDGAVTILMNGVRLEGSEEIEKVAKKRLEELVRLVSLCIPGNRLMVDELEEPRFISSLGDRISEDGSMPFEDLADDSFLDRFEDVPDYDGGDFGAESLDGLDRDGEEDDDANATVATEYSINLEDDCMGDELKKMLPTLLKDSDVESCATDDFITSNALFCGLMQEVSTVNGKDAKIGVLSPSVLKDWQDGKRMKKAEIDEMMFNRDPQRILIPIFQPLRDFEKEKIEHWVVGSYDVFGCSVTIYDSIEATKVEKDAVIGLLKELMMEWLGEDESNCLKYRFARKDRVEKQENLQKNKTSSGFFALLHARRLAQLEKDCSPRGRAPMDVEHERKRLVEIMKAVGPEFKKITPNGSQKPQQQQNQRKRKLPALTTPDFIKSRRDNTETREKIRRCYWEMKKRC